ncbi:MAG TPA: DUF6580 family putative transport protein [Bacillota bacterium]|nr:DUF6580 family putative transport protein [Bacillota bacterium]
MLPNVNGKLSKWLPYAFMLLAALSRWPGLFPDNFSAFYALAFCAGAFFPRQIKWWLPMGTLVASDIALNLYYLFAKGINGFNAMQLTNYAAFAAMIWFGTRFKPRTSFHWLLSGGILGAIFFYLFTNTAAWLFNPFQNIEYTKDLRGWLIALTHGTNGYPPTWQFFWNTLMSGGLFTGLFAGAMKLSEMAESAKEKETEEQPAEEPEGESAPDEAKA